MFNSRCCRAILASVELELAALAFQMNTATLLVGESVPQLRERILGTFKARLARDQLASLRQLADAHPRRFLPFYQWLCV